MKLMSESELPVRKAYCAECGGERNCDTLGHYTEAGADDYYSWKIEWRILRCRGCDHVFVQTVSTNSEEYDYVEGPDGDTEQQFLEAITYWPALTKRPKPEWFASFRYETHNAARLWQAMNELYGALDNELHTLAAIGLRTAFDVAAELLEIKPAQPFVKKLDELVKKGHIGIVDSERLSTLIEAGNASAHQGWKPSADELGTLMDVLEHFVHEAFVAPAKKKRLDAKVTRIRTRVPARQRPVEKNS